MIFPSVILTLGFIDDLLFKKVHNVLWIFLCALALSHSLHQHNVLSGLGGLGTATALLFPLFALRVLGAGDVKLMMAFGLATSPVVTLLVIKYGLLWAVVFGGTKYLLSLGLGSLQGLITGPGATFFSSPRPAREALRIPLTFPLLLGWMTHLKLEGLGL